MIENNYFYIGNSAIIYNFDFNHSALEWDKSKFGEGITEMGIEYKEKDESIWKRIQLSNSLLTGAFDTDGRLTYYGLIKNEEQEDFLFKNPVPGIRYLPSRKLPGRIVIKNLKQNTEYHIRSYYVKNNIYYYFNDNCPSDSEYNGVEIITKNKSGDLEYRCTDILGSIENDQKEETLIELNKCCNIINSMVCFSVDSPVSSWDPHLNSVGGGTFKAVIDTNLINYGAAANSSMRFASVSYAKNHDCIIHEMAHNLMNPTNNDFYYYYNGEKIENAEVNKIQKFMEFATGGENAMWRWQGAHNYPCISSEYWGNDVYNYLIAAACQVSAEAFHLDKLYDN